MEVTCVAMSLVGVDALGRPVTRLATYASGLPLSRPRDATNNAPTLAANDVDAVGVPAPTTSPSFAWMHLNHMDSDAVWLWQSLPSYLAARWAGVAAAPVSYSDASWWGLLNRHTLEWHQPLCAHTSWSKKLPLLRDARESGLVPSLQTRQRWPRLHASTTIYLGVGDGAAATLGAAPPGGLVVSVGTSAAVRVVVSASDMARTRVPRGLFCYRLDAERCVLGGAVSDGGSAVSLVSSWRGASSLTVRAEAEEDMPLPPTVVCLPFFSAGGERAPGWRGPAASGAFVGVRHDTTVEELRAAAACGVAMRLARIVGLMVEAGLVSKHAPCFASGGAMQSPLWRRCIAGALGRSVCLLSPGVGASEQANAYESTSLGAVLLATNKLRRWEEATTLCTAPTDPVVVAAFERAMEEQERMLEALAPSRL